jgi:putative transposase
VGWSIDNAQDSNLVVNALDMAIKSRQPSPGGIVHADHGVQFTSWAFTNKIRDLRADALVRHDRRLLRQLD